jgi:glycosyltransferase involved in cell wall biosynthesis
MARESMPALLAQPDHWYIFSSLSILVFAYACEPDRGSEPGAGWDWARTLASLDDTCVITRANNAETIERTLPNVPERDRLSFVYVDLPPWARFWKKGQRGVRVYYMLWQFTALSAAKRLRSERGFNVVWHVTLANQWMGSLAPLAGGRFVYGPVGGGAHAPMSLFPALGIRGAIYETARVAATISSRYLNPFARLAWRRAELILVQNSESLAWMPARHRHKVEVLPNALISRAPALCRRRPEHARQTVLYAGRLQAFKGVSLAIKALEHLPDWRLVICGNGPDQVRLRRLAGRANVLHRVEFRGWVEQRELSRVMREEADVLIFPSLRDQAPLVVAEATGAGLPVVCLDRGGPPLLGGHPVAIGSPRKTAEGLANAVLEARRVGPRRVGDRSEQLTRLRELLVQHGLLVNSVPRPSD